MKTNKIFLLLVLSFFLVSCVNNKIGKIDKKVEKIYYSSKGFAMVYEEKLYKEKIVRKKIDNSKIIKALNE